jgi:hypothetical protein
METDSFEAAVEAAQKVEDEVPIGDRLSKVAKSICHALELAAVCGDVEVALVEGAEGGLELQSPCFTIATELRLNGKPMSASGGARFDDRFSEGVGDGAGEPGLHNTIHANPIRRVRCSHIREDVVL